MRALFKLGSGEFLLDSLPNSGEVIFIRAMFITTFVYATAIFLKECVSPGAMWWTFSGQAMANVIGETIPWIGAIFAASYAALYTRFASQWAYLASLYNQIMATQAQAPPDDEISKRTFVIWKAGFIEDAEAVHLATKPMYAGVIKDWLANGQIRRAYIEHAPNGEKDLLLLEQRVNAALQRAKKF